jgi:hypothetical protein
MFLNMSFKGLVPAVLLAVTAPAIVSLVPSHAAASEAPAEAVAVPGYLQVTDIIVPVSRDGRLRGYVVIGGSIEFTSPDVAKSASPWLPKIVDVWIRDLSGMAERGQFDAAKINIDLVKKHLLVSVQDVFHDKEIPKEVMLQKVLYQSVR